MTKGEVENNSVKAGGIQMKLPANERYCALCRHGTGTVSKLIPPLIRLDKGRVDGELCICIAKSERKISFSITFTAYQKSLLGTSL